MQKISFNGEREKIPEILDFIKNSLLERKFLGKYYAVGADSKLLPLTKAAFRI